MRIIGLNNDMYISSACLLEDGKILAAGAEERFTREKLSRAFPQKAIEYCLNEAGIGMRDVDFVVNSWNPGVYLSKFNPLLSNQRRHFIEQLYSVPDHLMRFYEKPRVDHVYQEINGPFGVRKIYYIEHHRTHAANGFFLSPFDSAAILTADAQGEFESTSFCQGQHNRITQLKSINYPHSLGGLYSTFTEYLGFRANSDEWKVMALASYVNPQNRFYEFMRDRMLTLTEPGGFELDLTFFQGFIHEQPHLFSEKFVRAFGPPRKQDEELQERHFEIAAALQHLFEDAVVHVLNWLYEQTREKNLILSGGSFMNSVCNGKILELTPFEELFIPSAPDDSGNCFGAALYVYNHILGNARVERMVHNYYGPQFDNETIKDILKGYGLPFEYQREICEHTARLLADGKIIGWFQGRMEFGQRALGNRSILVDPRRAEMKDKVNKAVKFREGFRPFAPAVLQERQAEYFEIGQAGDVPFMEKVYPVRLEKRTEIPAVVHVDGSGRLQSVQKETNPRFHSLIKEFENITGVPVLLNTSFNLNGEPIVCTPKDAIRTFMSCGLDTLIMGNFVIHKGKQSS